MTMHHRVLVPNYFLRLLILGLCLVFSFAAFGQTETATLTGTVTDPSGASVADAAVQVTNVETGVIINTTSNRSGLYVVSNLHPGHYRVIVEKAGFKQMALTDLTLSVQDIASRNFQLQVGTVSESITVSGEGLNINTSDASVSTVVDQSYVANMPLNGRSFQDLILLTPGTTTQTPQVNPGNTFFIGRGSSGEFSVNGQRTESNYYTVDGVSANVGINANATQGAGASGSIASSTALGTTQAIVSVDDLQEFRVQSSTYSAEYGRNPGGQFAFETKSGTNQWHGTAYDYIRNDYFDANDWFNDYYGFKQPPLRQNDFGGTIGGPVTIPHLYNGKDKTFFFISYEGLRLTQPQAPSVNYVPDLCMRGAGPCPTGSAPAATVLQPVISAFPVPNGSEYIEQCDPSTPPCGPNGTGPSGLAQYIASWSNPSTLDSTSVRLDQVVGSKLKLSFRFSGTPSSISARPVDGFSPSVTENTPSTVRTYTAGATALITNRLSNDFRLNYSSNHVEDNFGIDKFGGSIPSNFPQLLGTGNNSDFISSIFSDDFLQASILLQGPDRAAQRQWNFVDTLSLSARHHQFKFGLDYRRLTPFAFPNNPDISYDYFGQSTAQSNSAFTFVEVNRPAYPLYKNFSAFAEDEWKVLPRLNVSMGLRWELNPPPGVTRGLQAYTVQGSGPPTWSLAPEGARLWHTTWYNFAPRLGAAYRLHDTAGWETVLRGGGGVFFDTGQQLGSLGFFGPAFLETQTGSGAFPVIPAIPAFGDPTKPPFLGVPAVFPPHLQLPYTLQWNASVEQALGKSQALTLSYVGSHASRLIQIQRIDAPPNPSPGEWLTYQSWQDISNGQTSDYQAMQTQFRRRLARGMTALGSYTWSHCVDYGSINFTSGYERGNCAFDLRHNFSGAFSYDLPSAAKNALANALLSHWGVDDRFTARTGFPVDLTGAESFDHQTGKRISNGLDFVQGQPVYIYGSQCNSVFAAPPFNATLPCPGGRSINPNAFEPVSSGFGDLPRNFARGFGAWQMDLAVRREFPIFERLKLQFRAEAFNVFNHPNFGIVNGSCGGTGGVQGCTNPQFGQATATLAQSLGSILSPLYQTGGPRSMQFALKLVF